MNTIETSAEMHAETQREIAKDTVKLLKHVLVVSHNEVASTVGDLYLDAMHYFPGGFSKRAEDNALQLIEDAECMCPINDPPSAKIAFALDRARAESLAFR